MAKKHKKENVQKVPTTAVVGAIAIIAIAAIIWLVFFAQKNGNSIIDTKLTEQIKATSIQTFGDTGNSVCLENGKPVVRIFSTTWCPHCKWIKNYVDSTVMEYVKAGKIIAYHWELDSGDNTLTEKPEFGIPEGELAIFERANPKQTIPTYAFGCKYARIGNGYERNETAQELAMEVGEFKAVIEKLLAK